MQDHSRLPSGSQPPPQSSGGATADALAPGGSIGGKFFRVSGFAVASQTTKAIKTNSTNALFMLPPKGARLLRLDPVKDFRFFFRSELAYPSLLHLAAGIDNH